MQNRLVSPRSAFWVTDILSDPVAREFVFGRGGSLEFQFPVAVKTGTSQAYRDNWTIGYTRDVTVGVWVGNFDRTSLPNSSGVTGAGPIFHAVMMAAQLRSRGDLLGRAEPVASVPPWCGGRSARCRVGRGRPGVPLAACPWPASNRRARRSRLAETTILVK
jgi:membrane carboxypeptidase/penicillin-binding protein PbpC